MKRMTACLLVCFLFASFVWCGTLVKDRKQFREELIRIHVISDSGSEEEQKTRLTLSDAVISGLGEGISGVASAEKTAGYIREQIPVISNVVNDTLEKTGSACTSAYYFCKEKMPARISEKIAVPDGFYEAIRTAVGKAEEKLCIFLKEKSEEAEKILPGK